MKTCLVLLLVLPILCFAEPTEYVVKGYTVTQTIMLPVSPIKAFSVMTGDISGWWDHSFSDFPRKLYIEPNVGGGFYEMFDDSGHGVQHAVVTYADPGKRLRMEGPLGLAGRAITFVTTWDYEAVGDSTRVTCTVNMSGQVDAEKAAVVDGVWRHFLVEQLVPYVAKQR